MDEALLSKARSEFHAGLLEGTLTVDASGIASNADRRELAEAVPPAYTEHIGRQLVEHLAVVES